MNKAPLSPINDYVFKRVFGEHLYVLADFLQAVLDLPVTEHDIRVVNPNFTASKTGDKLSALDVKVETKKYGVIDVEVQVEKYADLFKRFQYYTARMYADQLHSSEDYSLLTRAVSIVIADFTFFSFDNAFHHRFRLYDAVNSVEYQDSIEINILEIPKRQGNSTKISHWLEFFAARTEEQFMQVSVNEPAMEQAWGVIKQLSADEQERIEAEATEKARRDFISRIRAAKREGRKEERIEIAIEMLQDNAPIEKISKYTSLLYEEIYEIARKNNINYKFND